MIIGLLISKMRHTLADFIPKDCCLMQDGHLQCILIQDNLRDQESSLVAAAEIPGPGCEAGDGDRCWLSSPEYRDTSPVRALQSVQSAAPTCHRGAAVLVF